MEEIIKELEEVNRWLKNYKFDSYYPDLTNLINKLKRMNRGD